MTSLKAESVTNVLIIAVRKPGRVVLDSAVADLRKCGANVAIAACGAASSALADSGDLTHRVRGTLPTLSRSIRKRDGSELSIRVWKFMRRDPWVMRHGLEAHLLVALDEASVYTVWKLAQRNVDAQARFGLWPAKAALTSMASGNANCHVGRLSSALRAPRQGIRWVHWATLTAFDRAVNRALSRKVQGRAIGRKLWRAVLAIAPMSSARRAGLAHRAATVLVAAGEDRAATEVVVAANRRITSPALKAELRAAVARASFRRGRAPVALKEAYASVLRIADDELDRGDVTRAAELTIKATNLAFHRVLHIDSGSSPIAVDAIRFLEPLRASAVGRRLSSSAGRVEIAARAPRDRPLRLLLATYGNANFLTEMREYFGSREDVEVRFADFATDIRLARFFENALVEARLGGRPDLGVAVEQCLRPHLEWADTVFVDWMTRLPIMLSMIDPGTTRVLVRLHSFEVFSLYPHAVDLSRVDDLVFVSEHLRALTVRVLPALEGPEAPRQTVLTNAIELQRFNREKPADARFTLAMVGYGQLAKDPLWALRVIEGLREHDDRYRLLLVGATFDSKRSAATRRYGKRFEETLAVLARTGAVEQLGHIDDIPEVLAGVGIILSSSVRESFHLAIAEGAASGAVPVVRDWPFFAEHEHGARTVFPDDWVVATPEDAVSRILQTTQDEPTWRALGAAARAHALETFDWEVVRADYDRLLLGSGQ